MNHDIAHCDSQYYILSKQGEYVERFCSKRMKCKRYKAYLDLSNNIHERTIVAFISTYECLIHKHKLYLEDKE